MFDDSIDINLTWLDLSDYVSLIKKDNSEISISDINDQNRNDVIFIKLLKTKNFTEEFLINVKLSNDVVEEYWRIPRNETDLDEKEYDEKENEFTFNGEFGGYSTMVSDVINDYEGFGSTYYVRNIPEPNNSIFSATAYCMNQSINDYRGYLPGYGELKFIYDIKSLIKYIFKCLNNGYGKIFDKFNRYNWWSSTEYSKDEACFLRLKANNFNFDNEINILLGKIKPVKDKKEVKYAVLPLFSIKG